VGPTDGSLYPGLITLCL